MSIILCLTDAYAVLTALEKHYSHDSIECMHTLRDTLRQLKKGNSSVSDYYQKFKFICDQLAAIGHPVDDIDKISWFTLTISSLLDLGKLNYFLGLEVTDTPTGLFLSQTKYARDILARADLLDSKPAATPLATAKNFSSHGTAFSDPTHYRSLIGAHQYLTITRPDLSYAVNQVSQFLQAPTTDHFQAVKRILRYVKGTLTFGLTFSHAPSPWLLGYSDADWARCIETRRSTYGYSIFLGGNLVSWSAKKQPTVARSSCESEYRALANTASEMVWITHLFKELHVIPPTRPTILCDNKSAIFLSQNPVSRKRFKHIDIDYHFILSPWVACIQNSFLQPYS
ncbi:uncharacterized mitochondrial protein AtMg00810-like [Rutidosis leptorrhynchoides]|uniref:uncharacterized mitochondrial protein AtMg00810-like n=1 Tax=Rutidosis leptorrhynchoides TaxID=125765 RepID=UPI003A9A2CE9